MSNDKEPSRRRSRRWFQFRLSTLFLATLFVAALLGWQRDRISRWVEAFWNVPGDAPDDHPWPPVTIHVTIAQVDLNRTDEFGIELALADSLAEPANNELGFGGVILPCDNEKAMATIRALPQCRRLDVLDQSQVTALNNQPTDIKVGSQAWNVGLVLRVTPRVSQAGGLSLEIDVEKSELSPDAEGIPISVLSTGDVIRSPRVNTSTAQATVRVPSGQTSVLGGLINDKKELVVILTPYVIRNRAEAERVKMVNEQAFREYVEEREIIAGRAAPWAR